eukprot:UN21733
MIEYVVRQVLEFNDNNDYIRGAAITNAIKEMNIPSITKNTTLERPLMNMDKPHILKFKDLINEKYNLNPNPKEIQTFSNNPPPPENEPTDAEMNKVMEQFKNMNYDKYEDSSDASSQAPSIFAKLNAIANGEGSVHGSVSTQQSNR